MKASQSNKPKNNIRDFQQLKTLLSSCRASQRFRFSRKINQLVKSASSTKNEETLQRQFEALKSQIETDVEKRRLRFQNLPTPEYSNALPEIDENLKQHLMGSYQQDNEQWGIFSMNRLADNPQFIQVAV